MSAERTGCCAGWPKPCSYHEGYLDALHEHGITGKPASTGGALTFYLAARYSRREELCAYKADLTARGHRVPARWLLGEHQVHGLETARAVEGGGRVPPAQAVKFAEEDMADLLAADVLVNFTEQPSSIHSRGGRHVEFGIALGLRRAGGQARRLFVVGPLENVFHSLPEIDGTFDDWQGFLAYLDAQPLGAVGHVPRGVPT